MGSTKMHACLNCHGEGVVVGEDAAGEAFLDEECPMCEGSGWVNDVEESEDDHEDFS